MRKLLSAPILFSLLASFASADDKNPPTKPARSIPELQLQVEKILKDTYTPGVSVAIVHEDGPEWVAGLGKADVASDRSVTPETLFRIGSTSKAFASLAILMLADQAKLSLDDPVHQLVPEVWFENQWEATDPVRVVNLLEHTTGWDDLHLREYAKDAPNMTLREGLDYDHHSRISRWPPGTRMAYCNSGPAVAAYIVEKLTNQRFEDFVEQNLFLPIGMKTATYFQPPAPATTILYHQDGKTPYRYWNILLRPAGSINASAKDMAAYVQFYLNRGAVNGTAVVRSANIDRMENPVSTWAAKEGMKYGYGLSNYWQVEDGYVYHGHNGGVEGGLTEMAYLPEYSVGYFFSINAGSGDAFEKIAKAIRGYITAKLQKPAVPPGAPLPQNAADYAGFYVPDSSRVQLTEFIERLAGLSLFRFREGKLLITDLGAWNQTFLDTAGAQFRSVPKKGDPEPVATLILLAPKREGLFIQAGMGTTMKRIPTWLAILKIALAVFVLLCVLSILVYAPFWVLGGLSAKRRRPAERALRVWPLLAVLSLVAFVFTFILCSDDLITRLGNLTMWSALIFLWTIAFAFAVVASAVAVWRAPAEGVRPAVRRFSTIVTVGLLIALAYLAYWGMIGLRTWA
jgi:CubicO group peptidase (beta-lactamase class C family)